jgi:hypothetical protein
MTQKNSLTKIAILAARASSHFVSAILLLFALKQPFMTKSTLLF